MEYISFSIDEEPEPYVYIKLIFKSTQRVRTHNRNKPLSSKNSNPKFRIIFHLKWQRWELELC